ncbi:Hypothetical protein PHPALM_8362 [Phytophthora palmivora]|uniref:Uncharacterized protein n=1 Tax=Phytophthora palmivora TaxID=4796 RepID=A0A2P4YAE1_9STRA|nr:Hypothetical protein PHPALM_8362 [Phytophthora palmivora]
MRQQAQCKELQQLEPAQAGIHRTGAPSAVTDVGGSGTCNAPALREGKGNFLPHPKAREASGKKPRLKGQGNWGHQ